MLPQEKLVYLGPELPLACLSLGVTDVMIHRCAFVFCFGNFCYSFWDMK